MIKEPTCKSCGRPFKDHLGLEGTCRRLQEEQKRSEILKGIIRMFLESDARNNTDLYSDAIEKAKKLSIYS